MTHLVVLATLSLSGCAHPGVPDAVRFVREVHPDPYRYTSAAALDAATARAGDPEDPRARAEALQRVFATLGDAHLVVGLDGHPDVRLPPLLPLRVGDRVLVDASAPPLPLGTEIVSIEGRDARGLLDDLAALASVDGARADVRLRQAERRFGFLLHLAMGSRDTWTVVLRAPDGVESTVTLDGVPAAELASLERWSAPRWGSVGQRFPTTDVLADGTVILHLPTFGVPDTDAYANAVDAVFATLDRDARLVLDLRGNEGGIRTNGVAVLRHLLDAPFAQWRRVETRVVAIPRRDRRAVSFPFVPEEALTGFPGEREGDRWVLSGDPLAELMVPTGDPHRGELFVFVDDAVSSAAVELLAALLAYRSGVTVIGTDTMGECGRHAGQVPVVYGAGGASVLVSLFEITLVEIPGCRPGEGVPIDLPVATTDEVFLERRDPYLDALP
ncbi:MAG: hypothetical protein H6738_25260 [Alphaproteobacteria bacterium]|nr:hypothetical protein [Alphaproteobacteria bacterium]MCB9700122.1 hypothetical protein [Alphaproteobacteria bacterium]